MLLFHLTKKYLLSLFLYNKIININIIRINKIISFMLKREKNEKNKNIYTIITKKKIFIYFDNFI